MSQQAAYPGDWFPTEHKTTDPQSRAAELLRYCVIFRFFLRLDTHQQAPTETHTQSCTQTDTCVHKLLIKGLNTSLVTNEQDENCTWFNTPFFSLSDAVTYVRYELTLRGTKQFYQWPMLFLAVNPQYGAKSSMPELIGEYLGTCKDNKYFTRL